MGLVTNIMIIGSSVEENLEAINKYLTSENHRGFTQVDQYMGGDKHFEATVLASAFNYLDLEEFIICLHALLWDEEDIILIISDFSDRIRVEKILELEE